MAGSHARHAMPPQDRIQFPSSLLGSKTIEQLKSDTKQMLQCTRRSDEGYLRLSAQLFLDILEHIERVERAAIGTKRKAPETRSEMLEFPRVLLANRHPNDLMRQAYLLIDWVFEECLEHLEATSDINFSLMRYIKTTHNSVPE